MKNSGSIKRIAALVLLIGFIGASLFVFFPGRTEEHDKGRRSDELNMTVSATPDGERTDFTDADGNPAFAADMHYSSAVRRFSGSDVREEYFDENGEPCELPAGYYSVVNAIKGGLAVRTSYFGRDGEPVDCSSGYSVCVRTFNDAGQTETELFFDSSGEPVDTPFMGYGRRFVYDENGNSRIVFYLDKDGEVRNNSLGCAEVRSTFYPDGKSENEFFFDSDSNPAFLTFGQNGVHREYDEYGRNYLRTYLDAAGNPIVNTSGFTTLKYTYYIDDTVKTRRYYGIDGEPVALSHGQYGILNRSGKSVYLDKNGNEFFDLNNFLHNSPISVLFVGLAVVIISAFCGKRGRIALTLLYLAFVVYMTLLYRYTVADRVNLTPFWSYRQFFTNPLLRTEILKNVWLFVPLGALAGGLRGRRIVFALLSLAALSVCIEIIQYFTGIGLCELDDVFSNILGGLIGVMFARVLQRIPLIQKVRNHYELSQS